MSKRAIIILFFLLPCVRAEAQDAAAVGVVLPWQVLGFGGEETAPLRRELNAAHQSFATNLLNAPTTLDIAAQRRPSAQNLTILQLQALSKMRTGAPKGAWPVRNVGFQPVLCRIFDVAFVALETFDLDTGLLISSAHVARRENKQTRVELLRNVLRDATIDLGRPAIPTAGPDAGNAMVAAISLAKNPKTRAEESNLCLNLLFAASMLDRYKVVKEIGMGEFLQARPFLGVTSPLRRATRRMVVSWNPVGPRKLPVTFNQAVRISESVFGGRIQREQLNTVLTGGRTLRLERADQVFAILDNEERKLNLSAQPRIVHINRAWVYVDKGRAWGLDMNDRVVIPGADGQEIKGHVVGFYGVNAGLKNAEGETLAEGAIIYIRKGQKMTQVGQQVSFDPTVYPQDMEFSAK
jgi:hypothetical protein